MPEQSTTTEQTGVVLRCGHRIHGTLEDRVIVVKCRSCTSLAGHPVYHRFDTMTGQMVDEDGKPIVA